MMCVSCYCALRLASALALSPSRDFNSVSRLAASLSSDESELSRGGGTGTGAGETLATGSVIDDEDCILSRAMSHTQRPRITMMTMVMLIDFVDMG